MNGQNLDKQPDSSIPFGQIIVSPEKTKNYLLDRINGLNRHISTMREIGEVSYIENLEPLVARLKKLADEYKGIEQDKKELTSLIREIADFIENNLKSESPKIQESIYNLRKFAQTLETS
ncbi:MAG: hypothetical protein AB1721_02615 [Patescibacteria group bacterium]